MARDPKKDQQYYDNIVKAQKEQAALLQKIEGLEKQITKHKKENKIFTEAIGDRDQTAKITADAKLAAEAGRLDMAKSLNSLAGIEAGMMQEIMEGSIDLTALYGDQEELLKNINDEHAAEIAAMEEAGAGYEDIVAKLLEQKDFQEEIKDLMQEQVDKAIELNEEMDQQLITGETMRERLMNQNDVLKGQRRGYW